MRLLACSDTGDLSFTKDFMDDDNIPPYAILSHTWGSEEVLLDDILSSTKPKKAGFNKIHFCMQQARCDKLQYCWIDTCCINKKDNIELQVAINSMFRWYLRAARCYVFLSDVSTRNGLSTTLWEPSFRASRWFRRGWTLQELLAPRQVTFFSREGDHLGDRMSLERQIHEVTGVAIAALRGTPLSAFTVYERLSWMTKRETTLEEDKVYSLLGIFEVYMLPNYGETEKYAFKRLLREIDASAGDRFRGQISAHSENMHKDSGGPQYVQGRWLVAFPRPPCFAGRENQLERLRTHISSARSQRLAIYGLGGCGKTALALEIAYWVKEHHPACAVFWVSALSRDAFEYAYYLIAKLLDLSGIEDSREDVKDLVRVTLSDNDFGPWLMVVDNADDETVLFGPPSKDEDVEQLIKYLPGSSYGSIIFTTRTQAAAVKLAESNTMAIEELERSDAIAILSRRLLHEHQSQLSDAEKVDELLEVLQYHALAIVQAIAFINTNNVTISEYTALYRDNEKDATDLLGEDFDDQGRYRDATNTVAMTWYISFEQLQRQNPIAAEHLCFMACTASNDINASVFPPLYSNVEHLKAMGTLKAYAFVTEQRPQIVQTAGAAQKAKKIFDVHPLVHLATRSWLKAHRQWALWTETTLTRLADIVPYGDHGTREYWQPFLHHAMHLVDIPEVHDLHDRMTLLERVGRCQRSIGRYQVAERAYRQAWDQRIRTSGPGHADSLKAMGNIALVLGCQEKWTEAEKLHREELAITREILGERAPQTLITRGNLALAVLGQSKYGEAERMCRETVGLNKEVLGETHPDTLASMQNLAGALHGLGKHSDAESLHRETLALRRVTLCATHADTLSSLSALGTVVQAQRKYAEAESIHREELAQRIKIMGEEHPDTVKSMQKLGHVLCIQEKYTEAEKVQRKALSTSEKVSGPLRPVTLACKSAVAHTLHGKGKFTEAEQMHRETLAVKERVLGKEHREVMLSVYWLAEAVHDQARYGDALALYERALKGFKVVFGMEHRMTKECAEQVSIVREVLKNERAKEEKMKKKRK